MTALQESRLAEAPLLILEPHFDDAALSCAALLDRGEPVEILTVFAGDPDPPVGGAWDEVCGFADSAEALATRRREQEAAFAGTPHRVGSLPLLERQYLEGPRPASDLAAIGQAAAEWAQRNPGGLVALPAGAGWSAPDLVRRGARLAGRERIRPHQAHVLVRDAALAALSGNWTPLLYEELPYLFGGAADGAARAVARRTGRRPVELVEDVDRARKAARVACYASQLPHLSPAGAALDDPAALPPVERYWLLDHPGQT